MYIYVHLLCIGIERKNIRAGCLVYICSPHKNDSNAILARKNII